MIYIINFKNLSRSRHDSYSAIPHGTLLDGNNPLLPLSFGIIFLTEPFGIQSKLIVNQFHNFFYYFISIVKKFQEKLTIVNI